MEFFVFFLCFFELFEIGFGGVQTGEAGGGNEPSGCHIALPVVACDDAALPVLVPHAQDFVFVLGTDLQQDKSRHPT